MKRHLLVPLVIGSLAAVAAACGSDDDATSATSDTSATATTATAATTVALGAVQQVAKDVAYSSVTLEGRRDPLLDVYAPEGAAGLPLVVLFHGNPRAVDKVGMGAIPYGEIAAGVAAGGAVVVSANWGMRAGMPSATDEFLAANAVDLSRAACAVSFAAEHAAQYGADPSRLVLIGHSGGANMLTPLVLGEVSQGEGCLADTAWEPSGVVLWEGDMLALDEGGLGAYRDGIADVVAALTPWGFLDSDFEGPIVLAVTDTSATAEDFRDCSDPSWVSARDPSGEMQSALDRIDAFEDGCVDLREMSEATATVMQDHGLDATMIAFTDPTSSHMRLAPADVETLSATVQDLASS